MRQNERDISLWKWFQFVIFTLLRGVVESRSFGGDSDHIAPAWPFAPFFPSCSHAEADISMHWGLGQLQGEASLVSLTGIQHVLSTTWHELAQLQSWSCSPLTPLSVWLLPFHSVLTVIPGSPRTHSWVQSIDQLLLMLAMSPRFHLCVLSSRLKVSVAVFESNRKMATGFDDLISNFPTVYTSANFFSFLDSMSLCVNWIDFHVWLELQKAMSAWNG